MQIAMIPGANKLLSPPEGWDAAKSGPCLSLPVVATQMPNGQQVMLSAWIPTPDELAAMQSGAPVFLQVIGASHPPVNLFVPKNLDAPGAPAAASNSTEAKP